MERMDNEFVVNVLFEAFEEENWFYDLRIFEESGKCFIEIIVNEYFSLYDLEDVKDELRFYGYLINDDYVIMEKVKFYGNVVNEGVRATRKPKIIMYIVRFVVKEVE